MEKLIALDDAMCLQQNVVVPASFSSLAERIIAGERTRVNSQKPLRPWLPGWVVFPTAVVLSLWGMSLFTPPLTSVLLQCLITLVGVYLLAVRQGMMRT